MNVQQLPMTQREKRAFPPGFGPSLIALVVVYSWPLYNLAQFSFHSSLYSHALLIPFISLYLLYTSRARVDSSSFSHHGGGFALLGFGAALAGGYFAALFSGVVIQNQDYLAGMTLSFVLCLIGLCWVFLGRKTVRQIAFPLGFLGFMAPFPLFFEELITTVLQEGSAAVAHGLFILSGTPVFYFDLIFKLPGIALEVAPECSGIHSSLVLLLTSLLAGFFLLRTPWKFGLLALATVGLALFRNGLRIFIIGELCVRYGPEMIHSDIHQRGGPLFFALSLIPFSICVWWLWRSDRKTEKTAVLDV